MIPIIISKNKFVGTSKKTGKTMDSVIYNVLCTDRFGNFNVRPVFVDSSADPGFHLGDRVVMDSLSGSLLIHPSAPADEDFVTHLYSL